MADEAVDAMGAMLTEAVARRFGADRAEAVRAEIDGLAADLARVATTPLPDDVEPALPERRA